MTTEANQRIEEIQKMATDIFGSRAQAQKWLTSNNLALGCRPGDLLNTEAGASEVRRILASIATGGVV